MSAYRILTARLELRCWHPGEAARLKACIDDNLEHLRPWMPWAHEEPTPVKDKVQLLRRFRSNFDRDEDFAYGIFLRSDDRVVGGAGLHRRQGPGSLEIGYWIDRHHLGQGLATEAALALTRVAFELHQVDRVEIRVDPANVASAGVPKKLGFQLEATLRRRLGLPGQKLRDCQIYTMFAAERPALQAPLEAYDAAGERLI
ncbi:N-acetyltransferase [bacterium CPR1]|nr:N-acetyltransferase [bacterium CPR1]